MLRITAANAPQTVVFEGDMSPAKAAYLRHLGRDILHLNRRDHSDTQELTSTLVNEGRHPDLVEFSGETVLIGSEKDAPPGTVRNLLKRVLPYSPWKSEARVVIFQNAQGIKDEAETALLKTLEEPNPRHYFFLSVQTAEMLKETIRSRAVITHFTENTANEGLPADPWRRFYTLMGEHDFEATAPEAYGEMIAAARTAFDEMAYTRDDFFALEKILYLTPKKLFEKDTVTRQNRALAFAALPIMAAMRDRATQGLIPPVAPVVLSRITPANAVKAAKLMQEYLKNLEIRIFGNRPLNQHAVFYSFFFRFFPLWSEK
jgi:hypothetical protein